MSRVTVSAIPGVPTVSSSHFVASLGLLLGYWEGRLGNHEVFVASPEFPITGE